jgi:NodT family efflux transporter outer membrane factor (OMF) lipoprotein
MVGPVYHEPSATAPNTAAPPASYKESPSHFKDADWHVARPSDAMLRGDWWKVFKDPELDALEAQLNINDQNIKQFFQNYLQARALVREAAAAYYPTLSAEFNQSRSIVPQAVIPTAASMAALDASWEPDLWGKVTSAVRTARFNAQLSAADLENERLSEQASLAMLYFELRGQDSLQKILDDTVIADKKALDYNKAQYETGITDQISVVEAANTLQNAQATATNIGVLRSQYEHAIAVLVGKLPSNFSIPRRLLTAVPPPIPVGVPAELVQRRPDVAAAERAMAAANAQIGMAEAAYFPVVTLTGNRGFQYSSSTATVPGGSSTTTTHSLTSKPGGGTSSTTSVSTTTLPPTTATIPNTTTGLAHLFDGHNTTWAYGPSVSQTILDGGLRRATVRQYIATYNADLAAYRQSMLTAFQQVEDYLAQTRILATQLLQQREAEKSAQTFLKLEMSRFQTGIDPYIDVVTAQTTLLSDQVAMVNVQVQEMTGAVQLVKALGGGWDRSQLPSPSEVSKWTKHADAVKLP